MERRLRNVPPHPRSFFRIDLMGEEQTAHSLAHETKIIRNERPGRFASLRTWTTRRVTASAPYDRILDAAAIGTQVAFRERLPARSGDVKSGRPIQVSDWAAGLF